MRTVPAKPESLRQSIFHFTIWPARYSLYDTRTAANGPYANNHKSRERSLFGWFVNLRSIRVIRVIRGGFSFKHLRVEPVEEDCVQTRDDAFDGAFSDDEVHADGR